jgi:hypothetical protein
MFHQTRILQSSLVDVKQLVRVYQSLKNPKDKERVVVDALSFLARVKERNETVPPSHCSALFDIVHRIQSLGTPIRIRAEDFLANCDSQTSPPRADELIAALTSADDKQVIPIFEKISEFARIGMLEKSALIHPVESRILDLVRQSDNVPVSDISVIIRVVSALKLSNEKIFRFLIDSVKKSTEYELVESMAPATALKLIQDLGWSGFTERQLITEKLVPIFRGFKNYQALTSTLIIGGGLEGGRLPTLVANCMDTIRADRNRTHVNNRFSLSVEGHCQIIRRLVICGYFVEAMELFRHFTKEDYTSFIATNSTARNQIYRLFLASFVAPEIVPRSEVEFLQTDAVRTDTESQTMFDLTGGLSGASNSSFIHTLVVNSLSKLGYESVSEYFDPETMLSIDIYVPALRLGIEVQGPSHFITDLSSGETRMRPEDRFKIAVLNKVGINMEIVSIHDFGRMNATRNSGQYISNLISKYV